MDRATTRTSERIVRQIERDRRRLAALDPARYGRERDYRRLATYYAHRVRWGLRLLAGLQAVPGRGLVVDHGDDATGLDVALALAGGNTSLSWQCAWCHRVRDHRTGELRALSRPRLLTRWALVWREGVWQLLAWTHGICPECLAEMLEERMCLPRERTSGLVRVTADTVDERFDGVMIGVDEPGGYHQVPGWRCRRCGWTVGTADLPPAHLCGGGEPWGRRGATSR